MTPYYHALSSVKKFGGHVSDYIEIHNWFDATKQYTGCWNHRALRHHAVGIEEAIGLFGHFIVTAGRDVPTKLIAERHVIEDCGFIPTVQDWLKQIEPKPWMLRVAKKSNEVDLEVKDD